MKNPLNIINEYEDSKKIIMSFLNEISPNSNNNDHNAAAIIARLVKNHFWITRISENE